MMKTLKLLLAFVFLCGAALAQQPAAPPKPCTAPEAHQFDFWAGDWDASWPAGGGSPAGTGTNHVIHVLDGCVMEENFDGGTSMPLRGLSVSIYVPRFGKWKQTWVDNQGAYLDFVGEFKDGQMTLAREATKPDGSKLLQRGVQKHHANGV